MAIRRSSIGWCDYSGGDANFIIGCTPVSEGCRNCYARALIEGRQGRDFSKIRLYPEKLKRLAQATFEPGDTPYRRGVGSRPLVFLVDLGDWAHFQIPNEFRAYAFDLLIERDDVDWLWLTKRPVTAARFVRDYCAARGLDCLPAHFWMMATAEDQRTLARRLWHLHRIPATVKALSIEPMLEPMDLIGTIFTPQLWDSIYPDHDGLLAPTAYCIPAAGIDWVIVGAESGNNRRPFDPAWACRIRDQCAAGGIPFFYKQGSHRFPGRNDTLEGQRYKEFPEVSP